MLSKLTQSPRSRLTVYQIGQIASAALVLLAAWKVIDAGSAAALSSALTAVLGLFGVSASTVAATTVSKQISDGTLDFTGSAAEQAVSAIGVVTAQAQAAVSDLDRVKAAAADLAGSLPVVGPLARQVIDSVTLPPQ